MYVRVDIVLEMYVRVDILSTKCMSASTFCRCMCASTCRRAHTFPHTFPKISPRQKCGDPYFRGRENILQVLEILSRRHFVEILSRKCMSASTFCTKCMSASTFCRCMSASTCRRGHTFPHTFPKSPRQILQIGAFCQVNFIFGWGLPTSTFKVDKRGVPVFRGHTHARVSLGRKVICWSKNLALSILFCLLISIQKLN